MIIEIVKAIGYIIGLLLLVLNLMIRISKAITIHLEGNFNVWERERERNPTEMYEAVPIFAEWIKNLLRF